MNSTPASAPTRACCAADSLYVVGSWLMERQRYRDAAAVARALVRLAPCDERSWLVLGVCHEQSEQTDLALEMYGVGRVLASPAPRCELARARVFRSRGMYGDAREAYTLAAAAAQEVGDDDLLRFIDCERTRSW